MKIKSKANEGAVKIVPKFALARHRQVFGRIVEERASRAGARNGTAESKWWAVSWKARAVIRDLNNLFLRTTIGAGHASRWQGG